MITDMLNGLNKTTVEEVLLDISQVIALIGIDKTKELCLEVMTMTSTSISRKRNKKQQQTGLGRFNRKGVIQAIYDSQRSKNSGRTYRESEEIYNGSGIRT